MGPLEPAESSVSRIVPSAGDESAIRDWAAELVERDRTERVELTGDNGPLTALVRQVLQTGLEVEMTDHRLRTLRRGGPRVGQPPQRPPPQDG
jgi:hypothetical protein